MLYSWVWMLIVFWDCEHFCRNRRISCQIFEAQRARVMFSCQAWIQFTSECILQAYDATRSDALIYVRRKLPLLASLCGLSLDFLTHKMPTQHRCAAQKPNKETRANSLSMIGNLKSRNKLTRLTMAADSDCAKNKLSPKEFSTKRKWHMNLKYKNKLDSIKQIPSPSKLLKQKVSFSTRCNDLGFAPSILGLATSILTIESFWNLQNLSC